MKMTELKTLLEKYKGRKFADWSDDDKEAMESLGYRLTEFETGYRIERKDAAKEHDKTKEKIYAVPKYSLDLGDSLIDSDMESNRSFPVRKLVSHMNAHGMDSRDKLYAGIDRPELERIPSLHEVRVSGKPGLYKEMEHARRGIYPTILVFDGKTDERSVIEKPLEKLAAVYWLNH